MAHQLSPKNPEAFLSPTEIVRRVREEFGYADADQEAGADHVGAMIEQFLRMKAGYARWKNPPPEAAELDGMISRLAAVRDGAIMLTFGDDSTSEFGYVNLALIPDEPLIIGYCCGEHQDEAAPLVKRFASVLGYDMTLQ